MDVRTTVKIISNRKQWDRMKRNLLRGGDRAVDTGWWASRHPSGVSDAQIAKWNEEGHVNGGYFAGTYTPPRPAIRIGFMPEAQKIVSKHYGSVHMIAMGRMTWAGLNNRLSRDLLDAMKRTILSWNTPSNSPTTIRLKGFNDPLIETGNMYDAIKTRIVRRGAVN